MSLAPSVPGPASLARATRRDAAKRRERPPAVAADFQPDALELEDRVPPRIARATLYLVTAMILGAVAWASLSFVDEIVVAPGKLVTTKPTIVVQPLETSIIRSIEVAQGDHVRAGQILATLDSTFTQSDVDQQRTKFAALDAQTRRIEAELLGQPYAASPGGTADELLQARIYEQRKSFFDAQLRNFEQQIAGRASTIAASRSQETILLDRRQTMAQIENARDKLYKSETGSLLNFLASKDARLDVDSMLAQLRGNTDEANHQLSKLEADRQAFIEDFRRAGMEELATVRSQRDVAAEELKKMELRRNFVSLRAPSDAIVLDLAQRSIGSVVQAAEPVVTLVPANVPLEAEVSLAARDIGHVEADQSARVKFEAFPFQKYGTADGNVRMISQDAFAASSKTDGEAAGELPHFRARLAFGDAGLLSFPKVAQLLPGMSVTAEIKVGQRRVISYFLYPIFRVFDESIREP